MNRNVILGKDWLTQNGVRLYFDLGCLRIGKCYVSLEEDIKIAYIVRCAKDAVLKPHVATVLITINPGSDETYTDSKAEISTKLVAPKLGLFFNITGHTFTV
jgi:hypothetical protein